MEQKPGENTSSVSGFMSAFDDVGMNLNPKRPSDEQSRWISQMFSEWIRTEKIWYEKGDSFKSEVILSFTCAEYTNRNTSERIVQRVMLLISVLKISRRIPSRRRIQSE